MQGIAQTAQLPAGSAWLLPPPRCACRAARLVAQRTSAVHKGQPKTIRSLAAWLGSVQQAWPSRSQSQQAWGGRAGRQSSPAAAARQRRHARRRQLLPGRHPLRPAVAALCSWRRRRRRRLPAGGLRSMLWQVGAGQGVQVQAGQLLVPPVRRRHGAAKRRGRGRLLAQVRHHLLGVVVLPAGDLSTINRSAGFYPHRARALAAGSVATVPATHQVTVTGPSASSSGLKPPRLEAAVCAASAATGRGRPSASGAKQHSGSAHCATPLGSPHRGLPPPSTHQTRAPRSRGRGCPAARGSPAGTRWRPPTGPLHRADQRIGRAGLRCCCV